MIYKNVLMMAILLVIVSVAGEAILWVAKIIDDAQFQDILQKTLMVEGILFLAALIIAAITPKSN